MSRSSPRLRKADKRVSQAADLVSARRTSRDWPERYAGRLVYSDVIVIVVTMLAFRFLGLPPESVDVSWPGGFHVPYWFALAVVALVWLAGLSIADTRERHIVGNGILEYRRIVNATIAVFAFCIALAFFLQMQISRGLFLIAMPVGVVALIFTRWLWRQWLREQQRNSKYVHRTIVLGEPVKAGHVINAIRRTHGSGFEIVGVATSGRVEASIHGIPVVGGFTNVTQAMDAADADTIIVAGADDLDPVMTRQLGWDIADRDGNLVVAPALTDVAGPRIHTRPAAGLPLVHVDYPRLEGAKRVAKRTFDLIGASVLIIVLSPIMIATAIAIMVDAPGPVIYRQVRIGRRGREFGMLKFRSMVADADDQLASLLDLQGTSDRPLFKVNDDPRITRVGRFIRKHSLDELPQLFNVFVGRMSLVGPRPQRQAEVALYDAAARRRMMVKPGMSGLWQVSGRSTLSWDDAVRLDLYYVENWSFTQDLQILFRTFRAVLAPGNGAH
ncbi:sugar transferase [Microbacterium invictum]|uniref:Exopolysaccharide biosynthesis polyprenyl glycosylphosphotransferase n=1 Tax=Microbacterium invictum TaxID=515415 RepID=A0AA40SPT3_9MICO|nr:sugar transferase [Microbacterium invictum]MBB4140121.1 exopolysaccharide biosynthesis polyprenyl glycosylphosphotransferase [Microbacterium invictum]